MQQTTRAIVVKCDGSVYDVDVDVEYAAHVWQIGICSQFQKIQRMALHYS